MKTKPLAIFWILTASLLTACTQADNKKSDPPPGWIYLNWNEYHDLNIINVPKLWIPLQKGHCTYILPVGTNFDACPGQKPTPKLFLSIFHSYEQASHNLCEKIETTEQYINDANVVTAIQLVCPSPIDRIKLLYKLEIEKNVFFAEPAYTSTQEELDEIITSLLNARIEE